MDCNEKEASIHSSVGERGEQRVVFNMCRIDSTKRPRGSTGFSSSAAPVYYFRWGRLRFGFHGLCATLSLLVTLSALLSRQHPDPWVVVSILLNTITAYDARSLLDQVPLKTEIVPGIVAPHREAFQRTMSMMHYGNLRIVGKLFHMEENMSLYRLVLLIFSLYCFFPYQSNLKNGNTWIFVVPMFLGVSLDMLQLVWLRNVVQLYHYLVIEISALCIAFWFTLAFRGYISVPQIYLGSALFVAMLFGGGLYTIFG